MLRHLRRLDRCLLALTALALLVGACGEDDSGGGGDESFADPTASDDGSEDSGSDDDTGTGACDLLTTDQVAELLGQAVEDGEDDEDTCVWATSEPSATVGEPITFEIRLTELTEQIEAELDEAADDPANQPLDLGDRALHLCGLTGDVGSECAQLDDVVVAVGDAYLEVDLSNYAYPQDYAEDEAEAITVDGAGLAVDALA